jgi:hypothetical protein
MKMLISLCLCGLATTVPAQTTPRIFISPDGVFRFKHSAVLVDCMKERTQAEPTSSGVPQVFVGHPVGRSVPESCVSQPGICRADGSPASTVACFAYPKDKFKDKPTFTAAAFFVGEIKETTSEKGCLEGSQYWNIDGVETAKINGVTFKVFEISDNWAGGGQGGTIYRAFHEKKYYELGIQTATVHGGYDPGTIKEFTKQDWDEVQRCLKQALNSFRFVK